MYSLKNIIKENSFILGLFIISLLFSACSQNTNFSADNKADENSKIETSASDNYSEANFATPSKINVKFKLSKSNKYDKTVIEDKKILKELNKIHSEKYYSYQKEEKKDTDNLEYKDVGGNTRYMKVDDTLEKNNYKWIEDGVLSYMPPIGKKMSYGIDISKFNGDIDFNKVKNAGFEFVFIRVVYRGYGKAGNLKVDEMCETNLKKAKEAGLKIGAYVFSQATNEDEAVEEAEKAYEVLKDTKLDLPLVFDAETIKKHIARTDNVTGDTFTKNAIAFCEQAKKYGFTPAIYTNLVWQDYYFDMSKLQNYDIWYADYNKIPQTPYNFKYWQFSEVGIVDGIKGAVDLNVMIE